MQAVAAFTQALLIGTPDREVLYLLGVALTELGELERAERVLSDLVTEKPDHALAQQALARIYCELGRWEDEGRALTRAVAADPGLVEAHYRLGGWYSLQGRNDEAVRAYQGALAANPCHVLLRQGDVPGARTVLHRLRPLCEGIASLLEAGIDKA